MIDDHTHAVMEEGDAHRFWSSIGKLADQTDRLANEVHADHKLRRELSMGLRIVLAVLALQFLVLWVALALLVDSNNAEDQAKQDRKQIIDIIQHIGDTP